jgi:hypothetical protein
MTCAKFFLQSDDGLREAFALQRIRRPRWGEKKERLILRVSGIALGSSRLSKAKALELERPFGRRVAQGLGSCEYDTRNSDNGHANRGGLAGNLFCRCRDATRAPTPTQTLTYKFCVALLALAEQT